MSRKKTKNITSNASLNTSISPCIICLDEVRCRGKIAVCNHWFCFSCIVEWSKNTNTCPICKARFRLISKVHLSPMKSPSCKVRVPDRDQHIYDDDESLDEDMINELQNDIRDEMDGDYEPWIGIHLQQESDEYDLEDSFIDDSIISTTISYERHIQVEIDSEYEQHEDNRMSRESPYPLRRRAGRRNRPSNDTTITIPDELIATPDELIELKDSYSSGQSSDDDSVVSRDSFIVNDGIDGDDDDWSDTQEPQQTTSTRSTSSRSSRTSRNQASTSTRTSSKPTAKSPSRTTRNASRARQSAKQQVANKRLKEEQTISQNIRDSGSSGWLTTSRRPERASAVTAARVIAQTADQRPSNTSRGNRVTATQSDLQQWEEDTDDDVGFEPKPSTYTRKRKTSATSRKDSIRLRFSQDQRRRCDSDDSDSDTQLATTRKGKSNDQPRRSLRYIENTSTHIQGKTGKEPKNGKKGKGKENDPKMMTRQRMNLHQQSIDSYTTQGPSPRRKTRLNGRHFKASTGRNNDRVSAGPSTRCSDNDDDTDENRYNDHHTYINEHSTPSTSRIKHNNRPGPSRWRCYDNDDDDETDDNSDGCRDGKKYEMKGFDISDDSDVNNEQDKHDSSDNVSLLEDETSVLLPTPQDRRKRSLFTKRQHKPMPRCYDDDDSDNERKNSSKSKQDYQPFIPKKTQTNSCNTDKPGKIKNQVHSSSTTDKPRACKTRRRIQVYESDTE